MSNPTGKEEEKEEESGQEQISLSQEEPIDTLDWYEEDKQKVDDDGYYIY